MRFRSLARRARTPAALAAVCAGLAACGPAAAQEAASPEEGLRASDLPMSASARRGRSVYERWCIGCHGDQGRGDGPASVWLDPLPRNFQARKFKFRSTPSGELPTQDDLVRTITRGLAGSSMPAFPLVSEPERRDVAAYVLHLAEFGAARAEADALVREDGVPIEAVRTERMPDILRKLEGMRRRAQPIGIPPETPGGPESEARGRELYRVNCESCHGPTGIGDGPSSWSLRDWMDAPIRARDFTTGVLRGGDAPQDLFRRMRTGLDGTPMPSFERPDAELWDIVHFVQTLRKAGPAEEVR